MQHRVLGPADVDVDRQPARRRLPIERLPVVVWREEPREVPGGVDEGVHRLGLAARRPAADRAGRVHELGHLGERRLAGAGQERAIGQPHRQLLDRHRHRLGFLWGPAGRSRRSGSACPSSAGARSPSRAGARSRSLARIPAHGGVGQLAARLGRGQAARSSAVRGPRRPSSVKAASSDSGSSRSPRPAGSRLTGSPYLRANSKSRWSWAGTLITAPVP